MRILLTADPELPVPPRLYGGIERIVASLIRGLKALRHDVALAAHRDSTAAADAFFAWPGTSSSSCLDTVRNAMALRRAVGRFHPDVIHSFSRLMYLLPVLRRNLPLVMSYQRDPSLRTTDWANRLARGSLVFTGCSEAICQRGRRAGGSWTAIHNFVDLANYTFVESVPKDAPLVFLSRVETIKGAHLAIEAAKRTGRRLVIAGNHSATPAEADYWRQLIEPHLGRDGIAYVGTVDDAQKNKLLGEAVALLVPVQWDEPFGIVFAEALACGTPVISCPRGALPEIVTHGETGFLVESADSMVDAICQVGNLSRAACRHRAETHFHLDVIALRYSELYSKVVKRGGNPGY